MNLWFFVSCEKRVRVSICKQVNANRLACKFEREKRLNFNPTNPI
jgi:hypothetical protein